MHILMLFLDGVGLGDPIPENPFFVAELPTLQHLSNGKRWLRDTAQQSTGRAVFIPTDPRMGVSGRPQSGTGQAAIVTGRNISQLIGEHYGPKPNLATRDLLDEDNFFKQVLAHNKTAAMLEAYPPQWHNGINSGKRLPSSYQYAALSAGLTIPGVEDFRAGRALSGDWTGEGWHSELGFDDTPVYTPYEAGVKLVELSRQYDFAFFPHWLTDVVGHRGTIEQASNLLRTFDGVMAGVLATWDDDEGLVVITSDHGNIELIGDRRHTENDVPTVFIGREKDLLAENVRDLSDLVPQMANLLFK